MPVSPLSLAFKIATRYFKGKKSLQAINIISWISIGAIAISAAAMIILFSVFNGLENTVKELFTSFYPDLKVESKIGKFFTLNAEQKKSIQNLSGIQHFSYSLEDMVLLANEEEQRPAILKGIESEWFQISDLEHFMIEGSASWGNNMPYIPVLLGLGTASSLGIDVRDAFSSLNIYYPKKGRQIVQNPESALKRLSVKPEGLFHLQDEFDDQFVLTPLSVTQSLFDRPGQYSSLELKINQTVTEERMKQSLAAILGPDFLIKDQFQQNKTLFMIMKSEKWAVYAILVLVLVIASFNMIGSLSMLVLEKKKDIVILKSMGASSTLIRLVFLLEGTILALTGGIIGICFGLLVCLGQMQFGWIGLPDGFMMTAYPISFRISDFILVMVTILIIGILAAWFPALKASKQQMILREE